MTRAERAELERLRRDVAELRTILTRFPARFSAGGAGGAELKRVLLLDPLPPGEKADARVYFWDNEAEAWDHNNEEIEVRDYRPLLSGSTIPSSRFCIVVEIDNAWWVISTQC